MTEEYIEREKIKSYISQLRDHTSANVGLSDAEYGFISNVKEALENFPAADVASVKHGHWIHANSIFKCSKCGYAFEHEGYTQFYNFCPNCGAKMDYVSSKGVRE